VPSFPSCFRAAEEIPQVRSPFGRKISGGEGRRTLGSTIRALGDFALKSPPDVEDGANSLYTVHEDGEEKEDADGLHRRLIISALFCSPLQLDASGLTTTEGETNAMGFGGRVTTQC
jgi:hypothetical protein